MQQKKDTGLSVPRTVCVLALTTITILSSGCVVINDYTKPPTSDAPPQQNTKQPSEPVQFSMTAGVDVDTAYTRLKRTFGFRTLDEIAPEGDRRRDWIKLSKGYHHRMTPGVQYSMRERRDIDGENGIIQIDMDRDGTGTYLDVTYYAGGDHAFPAGQGFQQQVESLIREALR